MPAARSRASTAMASGHEISRLLVRWHGGDESALAALMPLVYGELRQMARSYLRRERTDHTLQATALVHELFVRFAGETRGELHDRSHFFGIAARAMRQILVEHARRHNALKRGGSETRVPLDDLVAADAGGLDLEALDAALGRLAARDALQARIVELRFFGGYTIKETAAMVKRSPATVSREWELARIWLFREVGRGAGEH
jgi:RNA polymerase sigma-70 factor (ECF subfamily)